MEENTNAVMDEEFGVDLSDVFGSEEDGDHTEETQEAETEQTETDSEIQNSDTAEQQEPAAEQTQETQTEDPDADLPEKITCKFLGGNRDIPRNEIRNTLQKGLNHDRVLQQRNTLQQSLNEQMQWRSQNENTLTELAAVAQAAGMDVPGLLNSLRVNMLVQQGMSRETAQERILAERAERQVAANQQQAQQQRSAQAQQEQARQRQEQDVQNFLRIYSGVDPRTIPQSVWAEVRNGDTLVSAYGRYQNQQLQNQIKELNAKLEAQKQNNNNKQRSLGSVKSSGNNSVKDDFLEGFND